MDAAASFCLSTYKLVNCLIKTHERIFIALTDCIDNTMLNMILQNDFTYSLQSSLHS